MGFIKKIKNLVQIKRLRINFKNLNTYDSLKDYERFVPEKISLKIAIVYTLFGGLWILLSDRLLRFVANEASEITSLQTYKGWVYVAITALMLYLIINNELKQSKHWLGKLIKSYEELDIAHEKLKKIEAQLYNQEDISERKKYEEMIHQLAYYDSLTKLPNRSNLYDRLDIIIKLSHFQKKKFAILFMDLDNFKSVNDVYGHNIGDKLLKAVVKTLEMNIGKDDIFARLGGDEFVILLTNIDDYDTITSYAGRILKTLNQPITIDDREFYFSASIGIAIYPDNGFDRQTLLKNADSAMNCAKKSGKNSYMIHTKEIDDKNIDRIEMENSLRKAIDNNELQIYYQPQIDINTGEIITAEALLRWVHPIKGIISPLKFIKLAEDTGLIIPIGEWVIREVCKQVNIWKEKKYPLRKVAINLSAKQFERDSLVQTFENILNETKTDPSWLEVEITETEAMKDFRHITSILGDLKHMGMSVSLDDFGTGYSSLNYLRQFPIDNVKIDKCFLEDIEQESIEAAIINAVINISEKMKIDVVAEGVETFEQLNVLKSMGCHIIQGYLFSKPLPSHEFEKLLEHKNIHMN